MSFSGMYNTQTMLFLLMILGFILKKVHIVNDEGEKFLTDLVLYVTLPASIVNSFQIDLTAELLRSCVVILVLTVAVMLVSMAVGRWGFLFLPPEKRRIMQYASVVSNAGILGNPVAEGIFGTMGLMYASIYTIPVRIFMWSVGIMYFTEAPDTRTLIKKVCTHPCIVAAVLGVAMMCTGLRFPTMLAMTVKSVAGANTSMAMMLVGTILARMPLRSIVDRNSLYYCLVRLVLLPLAALVMCRAVGAEPLVTGIMVTMTGMPAGSTTAVLARKYGCDAVLATKCVVLSTLLSMATIPVWCMLIG